MLVDTGLLEFMTWLELLTGFRPGTLLPLFVIEVAVSYFLVSASLRAVTLAIFLSFSVRSL